MKIGEYCWLFLPDRMRHSVGFILGMRSIKISRSPFNRVEYLVAHKYDIEWRVLVEPLPEGENIDIELCQVHPTLVSYKDMPESFTQPEFPGYDHSYGWVYIGPQYGRK